MANYSKHFNIKKTAQTQRIPGRTDQIQNSAGGFVFKVDEFHRLDRFLILGSEGGTYYASEQKLTRENAESILELIKKNGVGVVTRVVEISDSGRAPKNDPALFVLAMALKLGDEETRRAARAALPKVARIGTHLFHFAEFVEGFGGWGRGTKRAFADWYLNKPVDRLAEQVVKYQSRDGWSHSDLIRLAHVKTNDPVRNTLFQYAGAKYTSPSELNLDQKGLEILVAVEAIKKATSVKEVVSLIKKNKLPREVVPTEYLNDAKVWEALLPHMGLTAMLRNIATMTRVGLIAPLSNASKFVIETIEDGEKLKKARIHPIAVLAALRTYASGYSVRGSNTWTPVQNVVDALDTAFYASFGNVEPTGKNIVLALDISGSMGVGDIAGIPGLTPRDATAAIALVTASVEKNVLFLGFSHNLIELNISKKMRLDTVIKNISGLPFGGTDASLPIQWARKAKTHVDAFTVYTDNETWAGNNHPAQALEAYRRESGVAAKLIAVGMTATECTIADPKDAGSLNVVGFDTATPQLISDFIKN